MNMGIKEKLLLVWVLVMVVFGFLCSHFCGWTIYVLQRAVALNVVSLPNAVKSAVVICAACFLR